MKPPAVVCLGEPLLDLVAAERGAIADAATFRASSGGAPCNVAVGLARLGVPVRLVGQVGADGPGELVRAALAREGVDVSALGSTAAARTGLCFIAVRPDGERDILGYGGLTAGQLLDESALRPDLLEGARYAHMGTAMLLGPNGPGVVGRFLALAAAAGVRRSLDPNLRLHRWAEPSRLAGHLDALVPGCDVVKLAADEAAFVTGTADPAAAACALVARGVGLAVVTLGPDGAVWARSSETGSVPAPRLSAPEVVDTTGAGDGFMAGLLARLVAEPGGPADVPQERLRDHLAFACGVGAAVVRRLGAVAGLPRAGDIVYDPFTIV